MTAGVAEHMCSTQIGVIHMLCDIFEEEAINITIFWRETFEKWMDLNKLELSPFEAHLKQTQKIIKALLGVADLKKDCK